jgi:hypothetical protein
MITKPMSFAEAIRFLLDKEDVPAEWDAAAWQKQEADFRTRSFFSAKVENARFLDRAHGLLFDYMAKTTEQVEQPDGTVKVALKTAGREHFVKRMRDFMIAEGMAKPDEFAGVDQTDIEDIRSVSRLRLIFDTNVRQSYGFGQWQQGMNPAVLRAFPAARLIRERGVSEPRPRHQAHLGDVMLKTDPRWANFHNDPLIGGFGVPWGPYGFNSGVTQEDVTRSEARKLGLDVKNIGTPPGGKITDGLRASVRTMDPAVKRKLVDELRGGPKPQDPEEIARQAATNTRRIMLKRGLEGAEREGDTARADRYRDAISQLPPVDQIEIDTTADTIEIKVKTPPVAKKKAATRKPKTKGSDIGPKLRVATTNATDIRAKDRAMAAIDAVHGDGPLKEIPFVTKITNGSTLAHYNPYEAAQQIALEKRTHSELSISHEVGHWLDHMAFWRGPGAAQPMNRVDGSAKSRMYAAIARTWGSYGPEFAEFVTAARNSTAIKTIRGDYRLSKSGREYLLSEHEMFARAYAQWIAKKSGDPVMLQQVEDDLALTRKGVQANAQWEWDDFDLVGAAISGIFEKKGWLRK